MLLIPQLQFIADIAIGLIMCGASRWTPVASKLLRALEVARVLILFVLDCDVPSVVILGDRDRHHPGTVLRVSHR
jgi:hypothetical protein